MRRYDYTVVTARGANDLMLRVRDRMVEGWQPIGGVAVATQGAYFEIFQAMTKTREPPIDLGAPEYDP